MVSNEIAKYITNFLRSPLLLGLLTLGLLCEHLGLRCQFHPIFTLYAITGREVIVVRLPISINYRPTSPPLRSAAMAFRRAPSILKTLESSRSHGTLSRGFNSLVSSHTAKWMQDTSKKSPMELINEVPPIKVEGRIVACEGDSNPALGHPIEFICLDLKDPAICKYCGLRYVQRDHHH